MFLSVSLSHETLSYFHPSLSINQEADIQALEITNFTISAGSISVDRFPWLGDCCRLHRPVHCQPGFWILEPEDAFCYSAGFCWVFSCNYWPSHLSSTSLVSLEVIEMDHVRSSLSDWNGHRLASKVYKFSQNCPLIQSQIGHQVGGLSVFFSMYYFLVKVRVRIFFCKNKEKRLSELLLIFISNRRMRQSLSQRRLPMMAYHCVMCHPQESFFLSQQCMLSCLAIQSCYSIKRYHTDWFPNYQFD